MTNSKISSNLDYTLCDLFVNEQNNIPEHLKSKINNAINMIGTGLSFIYMKNNPKSFQIVRRSLLKLNKFDESFQKELSPNKNNVNQEILNLCEIALNSGSIYIMQGSSLELYKLIKLNGTKCEVAYISKFDSWIISLNNNSLILKTIQDLEKLKSEK